MRQVNPAQGWGLSVSGAGRNLLVPPVQPTYILLRAPHVSFQNFSACADWHCRCRRG